MTVRQQAGEIMDELCEDNVRKIIVIMQSMLLRQRQSDDRSGSETEKRMKAFAELEEMRNRLDFGPDFDPEAELAAAIDEKYGPVC